MNQISQQQHNYWKEQYTKHDNPNFWIYKAEGLKYAADILLREITEASEYLKENHPNVTTMPKGAMLTGIWCMLAGYTLENLIKGIYVSLNDANVLKDGKFELKDHDLHRLINVINNEILPEKISLNKEEEYLLTRMTSAVIWWGKYPIPLKYESLIPSDKGFVTCFMSGDPITFNKLYDRLYNILTIVLLVKFKSST